MKHRAKLLLGTMAVASMFAQPASANIGIPMLAVAWPAYWIALLPVIVFEAYVGSRTINLKFLPCLKVTTVANLISTFVGIPLVWAILVAVEMGIGYGIYAFDQTGLGAPLSNGKLGTIIWMIMYFPWLPPNVETSVIYIAFVLLAVPFCIGSIWIESAVARRFRRELPAASINYWIRTANVLSYFAIILCSGIYWYVESGAT